MSTDQTIYDAVIVGAGMSGLVCGCYLAKSGMNVVIAEQHHMPGGYCTSFRRKGFLFDAAAQSFGSYREGGTFRTVIKELGLTTKLTIKRYNPSDIVVAPDRTIFFWTDQEHTIQELQKAFPRELKIRDFINFIADPKPAVIASLRKKTFQELLDHYFADEQLKSIIAYLIFGNGGLPPSLMSAFIGSTIFSEFIIDGGYYPEGGMQELPDRLAERFKELGGMLLLSSPVTRIMTDGKRISGVALKDGSVIRSRYVISNCDARQTFLTLLGEEVVPARIINKVRSMTPSLSFFIVYLGLNDYFDSLPKPGTTLWYLPHYNVQKIYDRSKEGEVDLTKYLVRVSPSGKSVIAMANTSFKKKQYWLDNKDKLLQKFVEIIEQTTLPSLSKYIMYKEAATPQTLCRYTLNDQGAAYGWESTRAQFVDSDFRKPSFLHGLYLTGHWTTYAQGIAGVVYLGHDLAKSIIQKERSAARRGTLRCAGKTG